MADYQTTVARGGVRAEIDAGLRAHMNKTYMLMAVAMVISGVVAYVFGQDLNSLMRTGTTTLIPADMLVAMYSGPIRWVIMFAPLGVVFLLSMRINSMSVGTAQTTFWIYAALVGLSIASIFAIYTGVSIAQTFFVTAVAFLGLSLYGYTTKTDLSAMGRFLVMGLIGLIVASIVNIFLGSDALSFAISTIGVLIFAGLTAYDTQQIKNEYLAMAHAGPEGQEWLAKGAIMGALRLYLDFLNMFLFLLHFMGGSQE